jgi:hypothetical protein
VFAAVTSIKIPALGLVMLIGPSGSGKSTFARKHFRPSEILNSDSCRAMVSDDENDQSVSAVERNRLRDDRKFGPHVIKNQRSQLRRSLGGLGRETMQGRAPGQVREFALYGETTGETDELGLPVRYNWAAEYRGRAEVVCGHTPVPKAEWLNRMINIDTGCVFGGALTALRYPEHELVSVPAARTYCEPARPFLPAPNAAGERGKGSHRQNSHLAHGVFGPNPRG